MPDNLDCRHVISELHIKNLFADNFLHISDCFNNICIEFDHLADDFFFLEPSEDVANCESFACPWRTCNHQNLVLVFDFVGKAVFDVLGYLLYFLVAVVEILGHIIPAQKLKNFLSLHFNRENFRLDVSFLNFFLLDLMLFFIRVVQVDVWSYLTVNGVWFPFGHF